MSIDDPPSSTFDDAQTLTDFLNENFSREIEALRKHTRIGFTIATARHALDQIIGAQESAKTKERFFEIEAWWTTFVISYGRLFSSGSYARFKRSDVPDDLLGAHDVIMKLRQKRFAHNDQHRSASEELMFLITEEHVLIGSRFTPNFPTLEHLDHAGLLLDFLSDKMMDKAARILAKLSVRTGRMWSYDPAVFADYG